MKYEFRGFSESQGAYIQGALQAVVHGPEGRENDARELAQLMADGHSREQAAEQLALIGCDATWLRVVSANRVK